MKKPSRLDYAYAVGRVRSLERTLITRAVFSEASEEKDFLSAMRTIFEAGDYEEEMVKIQNSDHLDDFIAEEKRNVLQQMIGLFLDEDIIDIIEQEFHPDKALASADRTEYVFVRDYLRHKIDLANLKILCRSKYLGFSPEKFASLELRGGFLDPRIFVQNYELSYSEIGEKFRSSPYLALWNRATDILEEKETFVELERGIEDFLMTYLIKAKYIVFGPEPVFAYVLAKSKELDLVRLVGVGKLNQVPPSILKQRISETYV
ncbi:MAG: V-type ATPase subunit [Candidatus Aminicenantes bacterium]